MDPSTVAALSLLDLILGQVGSFNTPASSCGFR